MYKKKGYFENIDDALWQQYILASAENWFLTDPIYCGPNHLDYDPSDVGDAALGLLTLIQKPDHHWAWIIQLVLEKITGHQNRIKENEVLELLKKWSDSTQIKTKVISH